jgi:hypothetical protein
VFVVCGRLILKSTVKRLLSISSSAGGNSGLDNFLGGDEDVDEEADLMSISSEKE